MPLIAPAGQGSDRRGATGASKSCFTKRLNVFEKHAIETTIVSCFRAERESLKIHNTPPFNGATDRGCVFPVPAQEKTL